MSTVTMVDSRSGVVRDRERWMMASGAMTLLGIATAFSLGSYSVQVRTATLVERLVVTPPAGFPFAMENLRPFLCEAKPLLRRYLDESPQHSIERLHAAFALMEVDASLVPVLLDEVPSAPESECRNFVAALKHVKQSAGPALVRQALDATDPVLRVRSAILALHLGSPEAAQNMLTDDQNPENRTAFLHTYAKWHGDLTIVTDLLRRPGDTTVQSSLCLALGTIDPAERDPVATVLQEFYLEASDGATHSAAGWALRTLGCPLPEVAGAFDPTGDRRWFINGEGITMIEVPAGQFTMGTAGEAEFDDEVPAHKVEISRPFFLADREVTVAQFQRFLADSDLLESERPALWERPLEVTKEAWGYPIQKVSWCDAVLYCNWLSQREGRRKCYERIGKQALKDYTGTVVEQDQWQCVFASDGYRLPTEAEWEYAARAGSTASFCFGEGLSRLQDYAWFINNSDARPSPGGLKMPNLFGLHDMHGNVAEWCWDADSDYPAHHVCDPTGDETGFSRVYRGGSFGTGALGCRSAFRSSHLATVRSPFCGFRICCSR